MVKLKYLLDINICIYLMKGFPPEVALRFTECKIGEIGISALTWAELSCGLDMHNSHEDMQTFLRLVSPQNFDVAAATVFGQLSQQYPSRKNSLDRMIAAHALSLGVTLVSNNLSDFELYCDAGLKLENWVSKRILN